MISFNVPIKDGKSVVIRRAKKGDEYGYADVSARCYCETRFLSRCTLDDMPSAEELLGFIEEVEHSDKEVLLVAVYDNLIVGFGDITACLNKEKMKHKCDLNVSVLKDYWHMGIGKALVSSLVEFAGKAGYEQVNLNVASDNLRAIGLYEHLGFCATGREVHAMKHADGDYSDFIFMTKLLT